MNKFTESQLTLILAFYVFKYKKSDSKSLNEFTSQFNDYYNIDANVYNIIQVLSVFNKIDPRRNTNINRIYDDIYYLLCNKYIENEKLNDLKKIYKAFKENRRLEIPEEEPDIVILDKDIVEYDFSFTSDKPKELYETNISVTEKTKRSSNVVYNALVLAGYKCEFSDQHKSFIRKYIDKPYTEVHHLVPLKFQKKFNVNLDVEANVVSLCSECHNKIHYGKDWQNIIIRLYNLRSERLKKCGINISLNELLKLYDGVENE